MHLAHREWYPITSSSYLHTKDNQRIKVPYCLTMFGLSEEVCITQQNTYVCSPRLLFVCGLDLQAIATMSRYG